MKSIWARKSHLQMILKGYKVIKCLRDPEKDTSQSRHAT